MILRQHNALVVILSDANLTKISPPLHWAMSGQLSTELRLILGQCSVEIRSKRRQRGWLITDESCLEQDMSGANGSLKLNHLGLGSGDWYVRHQCSGFGEAVGRVDQTIMRF